MDNKIGAHAHVQTLPSLVSRCFIFHRDFATERFVSVSGLTKGFIGKTAPRIVCFDYVCLCNFLNPEQTSRIIFPAYYGIFMQAYCKHFNVLFYFRYLFYISEIFIVFASYFYIVYIYIYIVFKFSLYNLM